MSYNYNAHSIVKAYAQKMNMKQKAKNTIQPNLNSSNTDGSFTTANSNFCLSTYEILPIA